MKQNRILLILVVVLAAGISWFIFTQSSSTLGRELQNFSIEDTASIDKIFIADKNGNSSTLDRISPTSWKVNNKYPVRPDAMNTLLQTFNKMKVRNPVAKSLEPKVLRDLAGPVQKKVEVFSNGRLIKTLYVGTESVDKLGTYMLLENSSAPFEVHIPSHRGFLQSRFIVDEDIWRDPAIFRYDYRDIRSVQVRYPEVPMQGFDLTYDGKEVKMSSTPGSSSYSPNLDTLRGMQYLNEFRNIGYEYVVVPNFPKAQKDSILASQPFAIIKVSDKNGIVNEVKGFHRKSPGPVSDLLTVPDQEYDVDRLYGLVNGKDFVLIQFFQFDRVLKTRSWLEGKQN
ncbi:MAG: DUF4340 domain-containing protein [Bacteroidia bacterium]